MKKKSFISMFLSSALVAIVGACMYSPMTIAAKSIDTNKLPASLILEPTKPLTLIVEGSKTDLKTYLLNQGAIRADIYSIIGKDKNEYIYAIVGDINFGSNYVSYSDRLSNVSYSPSVPTNETTNAVPAFPMSFNRNSSSPISKSTSNKGQNIEVIKSDLVKFVDTHEDRFQFVVKSKGAYESWKKATSTEALKKSNDAYEGTMQAVSRQDGKTYTEFIHFRIYEDKYYGASIRFLEISQNDQQRWGDTLNSLMKQ